MSDASIRGPALAAIAAGLATIALGCGRAAAPPPAPPVSAGNAVASPTDGPWFRDATADWGIDFTYRNGEEANHYTLLESVGGGVGLIDYDRDGWLDVVLPGGGGFDEAGREIRGLPTRIFRNLRGAKFADVTEELGLPQTGAYTHGVAVADYDRDGWPDFAVTGFGRLALYHNEPGDSGGRAFREVAAKAGIDDRLWSTSAAWGDLDGNGYADLFVCHYTDWSLANNPVCPRLGLSTGRDICPPQRFAPQRPSLFMNQGDGTFQDVSADWSLRADGCGLGVFVADLDANGQPDVYVANDATPNFLYMGNGGRLVERAAEAGVAWDEEGQYDGSMGVDAGDYSGSGLPALWVTNFQDELHALYAQRRPGIFYHASRAAGIAALGRKFVGFGTGFLDYDNDGWLDLVIANGHVQREPTGSTYKQRAVLLHNVDRGGQRSFENASSQGGDYFQRQSVGRGLAIGDLDNDGWPDLVISHTNSPVVVLHSEGGGISGNHWLGIELAGKEGPDVAGATVTLEVGSRQLVRLAKGGGSYCSSCDRRIVFGLGKTPATGRLTVQWPWGKIDRWDGLTADRYHRLEEANANAPQ